MANRRLLNTRRRWRKKYEVDAAMVTSDLLELAGKMAKDDLVDSV